MPPVYGTDEPLWYNVNSWGKRGYAVPNFGSHVSSLNEDILDLVSVVGKNLFAIMHDTDADLTRPPSINTVIQIHRVILRSRTILAARTVKPGTPRMESQHASPVEQVFLIYPIPYFQVRNNKLKQWCGLVLAALAEATQHTENRFARDYSPEFSGLIGQYFHRIYSRMASELFGIDPAKAEALDFTLTDADLAGYDPAKYFTSQEMVDAVPPFDIPTEDDYGPLALGIPATQLVGLARYPSGQVVGTAAAATTASQTTSASSVPAFSPPPSP